MNYKQEQLLMTLQIADTSDATFKRLIERGLRVLDISDKVFADKLGVSRPTVTRWRLGNCTPHKALRPTVYKALIEILEKA